jgi:hypothetical protein
MNTNFSIIHKKASFSVDFIAGFTLNINRKILQTLKSALLSQHLKKLNKITSSNEKYYN